MTRSVLWVWLALLLSAGCDDWGSLWRNARDAGSLDGDVSDGDLPDGDLADAGGPLAGNVVFVTSTSYVPGSLKGPAGADQACQDRATAAQLPGTYKAWVSTSAASARSRLGTARGWVRTDGRPFADSVAALTSNGQIFYPARLDEFGHDVVDDAPYVFVATGTAEDGTTLPETSDNFSSSAQPYMAGDAIATTGNWTLSAVRPGSEPARLYCFGVDSDRPLTLVKTPGRLAFLTAAPSPITKLADADDACMKAASAHQRSGNFAALLSTTSTAASTRFDLTGANWVRVDGIAWLERARDLAVGRALTGLNVDLDGVYIGYSEVWTGSVSPGVTSLGAFESCNDWMSTSAMGTIGWGQYSNGFLFDVAPNGCNSTEASLYCLQK